MAVAGDRFGVGFFRDVQLGAPPQYGAQALHLRAVRVLGGLAPGVVLAMDRHPVARRHPRGDPQPKAEEVTGDRMQVQRPVRLRAVQEDGDGGDGDVRERQRHQDQFKPVQTEQSPVQEFEHQLHSIS